MKETKYTVKYTTGFKKDYKRAVKRGLKIELLEQVVAMLAMGEPLPDKNRDHDLYGGFSVCKRGVVKRDDLDSGTPKRGIPYHFDKRNQYATLLQSR